VGLLKPLARLAEKCGVAIIPDGLTALHRRTDWREYETDSPAAAEAEETQKD
jgi:hypothetical protein